MKTVTEILLHLGTIIKTLEDLEKAIQDVVQGKASQDDLNALLTDLQSILSSGIINIPGATSDQITQALADIAKVI